MRAGAAPPTMAATTATSQGAVMSTSTQADGYVLGRTNAEYERLRAQSRVWEQATGRLLDQVELAQGARCLDAGSGPGETMRQLAQRVGPAGEVVGVDVDAALGAQAIDMLHGAGHRQCSFAAVDLEGGEPIPGAPFDLVYARLLLLHVSDPVAVLRRLWAAVGPGGHLVVHDYDLSAVDVLPPMETMEEWRRVVLGAFTGAGCDIRIGHRLPQLFAEAGLGVPDGTDVAGRLEPLRTAGAMLGAVHGSMLPAAVGMGLTTQDAAERWREAFALDVRDHGERHGLWPLLIGAWKRR
jgi:SAM-dependent methyltransferase